MFYLLIGILLFMAIWYIMDFEYISSRVVGGFVVLIAIFFVLLEVLSNKIEKCEYHLPRGERCILVAVPEYTIQEKNND